MSADGTLFTPLRVGGYRHAFDKTEETKYVVATVEVRIAIDPGRSWHGRDHARGVVVMTERVVHAAADAYAWYSAQVDSVTLVGVEPETVDD